jgi:CysZ protein
MINSFLLAFRQLKDSRFLKPLAWSSLFTIVSIIILWIFGATYVDWLLDSLSTEENGWLDGWWGWIKLTAQFLVAAFIIAIAYFFFGIVHAAYLGLFLDGIVEAVRDRHYPNAKLEPPPKLGYSMLNSTRFVLMSLAVNVIMIPFYLVGWFFPPTGLILQIWINGMLLGKEYGNLIELRMPPENRMSKLSYTRFGMLAEVIWMIPVANFLAPVLLSSAIMHDRMGKNEETTSD